MGKQIIYPFATDGDRTTLIDTSTSTAVNYQYGWSSAYALDSTESGYRYIDRQIFNQVIYDITVNQQDWQLYTYPEFYSGSSYGKYAIVRGSDDVVYVSSVSGNTTDPTTDTTSSWVKLADMVALATNAYVATTEDEINNAVSDIVSSGQKGLIVVPTPTGTVTLSDGIVIDCSYVSIIADGVTFDATSLTSASGITYTGSVSPAYSNETNFCRGYQLLGPGSSNTTYAGELIADSSGYGPSRYKFYNTRVKDFFHGHQYGDNAYATEHIGCFIQGCGLDGGYGIYIPSATNSGENILYSGGGVYNGGTAIGMGNANAMLNLQSASIDYNSAIANISSGSVDMDGGHCEASDYDGIPIEITNASGYGSFNVRGGWWLLTTESSASSRTITNWVDCADSSYFSMTGTKCNNMATNTLEFDTGTGYVRLDDLKFPLTPTNWNRMSSNNQNLADGDFEISGTTLIDNFFLTADTATITDRYTGTNISIEKQSDDVIDGTYSLKATKTNGGGSAASFAIGSKINNKDIISGKFSYSKPGTATGTLIYSFQFALIENDENGVPVIKRSTSKGSSTVTFTSSASGTVSVNFGSPSNTWKAPSWATHFIILLNMNGFSGGSDFILFDDFNISKVG